MLEDHTDGNGMGPPNLGLKGKSTEKTPLQGSTPPNGLTCSHKVCAFLPMAQGHTGFKGFIIVG